MVNQTKVNVNRIDNLKTYLDNEIEEVVADITFDKDTIRRLVEVSLEETLQNYVTLNTQQRITNKSISVEDNIIEGLNTVAYTGSYNDLSDTPTIPAAQVQSDWTATSGKGVILHKPALATVATSGSYNDLTNKPALKTVATSGSYNDLSNKPTVGTGVLTIQKNGTNVTTFSANATSGTTANITVPTKVSELSNDSGYLNNSNLTTVYCVTSKSSPGVNWWRVWSDGWIEQGGEIDVTTGWQQFSLLKQFANTNYFITGTCANNVRSTFPSAANNIGAYVSMMALTQSTFKAWTGDDATFNNARVRWFACGY